MISVQSVNYGIVKVDVIWFLPKTQNTSWSSVESFCLENFHHLLNFQPPIFSPLSTDSKSSSILTSDFFQVLNKNQMFFKWNSLPKKKCFHAYTLSKHSPHSLTNIIHLIWVQPFEFEINLASAFSICQFIFQSNQCTAVKWMIKRNCSHKTRQWKFSVVLVYCPQRWAVFLLWQRRPI